MQDIAIEGALNELLYGLIIDQFILKVAPVSIILNAATWYESGTSAFASIVNRCASCSLHVSNCRCVKKMSNMKYEQRNFLDVRISLESACVSYS